MDYTFNAEIASKYGVEEAVFIHNLYFWIKKNIANNKNYYNGMYWTYNTRKEWAEWFPFWSEKQVRRITENLTEKKVLYTGNFNASKYDRTIWYALSDEIFTVYEAVTPICPNGQMELPERSNGTAQMGKSNCPNGQMELPEQANGIAQTGTPIPDIIPDTIPNSKTNTIPDGGEERKTRVRGEPESPPKRVARNSMNSYQAIIDSFTADEDVRAAIWAYLQMRVKKKKAPTDYALELICRRLSEMAAEPSAQKEILDKSTVNEWADIFPLKEPLVPLARSADSSYDVTEFFNKAVAKSMGSS